MCTKRRRPNGFALPSVIVLMSALLLLSMAFLDAVVRAQRAVRSEWQGEQALHSADGALLQAISQWVAPVAAAQRLGEIDTVFQAATLTTSSVVQRTRLSARHFRLIAVATVSRGTIAPARRAVARMVLLDWPFVPLHAAVTLAGPVRLADGAQLFGVDAVPAGWGSECESDRLDQPVEALSTTMVSADSTVTVVGRGSGIRLYSAAERTALAAAFDSAWSVLLPRSSLTTADSILSTDEVIGTPACPRWFGAADRSPPVIQQCARQWPAVHVTHSRVTRLTGSTPVQGVMLVDGDLHILPGVRFNGVILVRGAVVVAPDSAAMQPLPITQLLGGVLAKDSSGSGSQFEGPILVQVSRCAARLALAGLGRAAPLHQHGWSEQP